MTDKKQTARERRGRRVRKIPGFELGFMQFESLCKELLGLAGVTGTWLKVASDHEANLYVTVMGCDEVALHDQMSVYRAIETYVQAVRPDMDAFKYAFNYSVLADDESIGGDPLIPAGAKQIA